MQSVKTIVLALLLGACASAHAISIAQACQASDPVFSCTMGSNVSTGDILVLFGTNWNGNVVTVQSDSLCGLGTNWTLQQSVNPNSFSAQNITTCRPAAGGAETITVVSSTGANFTVLDITAVDATTPIDTSVAFTTTTVTTTVSSTITTSTSGDLVLAFEAYEFGTSTMSANNSFTWTGSGNGTSSVGRPWNVFSITAGAAGAYPVTFTNNNAAQSRSFSAAMIAFKPGAAPPPPSTARHQLIQN